MNLLLLVLLASIATCFAQVPKRIWAYWNSPNIPPLVRACMQNWRHFNSDYEITVLSPTNIHTYVTKRQLPSNFEKLTAQAQADWARLAVVYEQGGIYVDASSIMTESLDWVNRVIKSQRTEGILYYLKDWSQVNKGLITDSKIPVIENWFIASKPNNKVLNLWLDEFEFIIRRFKNQGKKYLNYLKKTRDLSRSQMKQMTQKMMFLNYLTQHLAIQKLANLDNVDVRSSMTLIPADGPRGPYNLLVNARWNPIRTASLMFKPFALSTTPKFFKINGQIRRFIEKMLKLRCISPTSVIGMYLSKYLPPQKKCKYRFFKSIPLYLEQATIDALLTAQRVKRKF